MRAVTVLVIPMALACCARSHAAPGAGTAAGAASTRALAACNIHSDAARRAVVEASINAEAARDFHAACAHWTRLADAGDTRAMPDAGRIDHLGLRGRPDYTRATDWYLRAGETGGMAANNPGVMVRDGPGQPAIPRSRTRCSSPST